MSNLNPTQSSVTKTKEKYILQPESTAYIGLSTRTLTVHVKLPDFNGIIPENDGLDPTEKRAISGVYNKLLSDELGLLKAQMPESLSSVTITRMKRFEPTTVLLVMGITTLVSSITASALSFHAQYKLANLEESHKELQNSVKIQNKRTKNLTESVKSLKTNVVDIISALESLSEKIDTLNSDLKLTKLTLFDLSADVTLIISEINRLRLGKFPSRLIDDQVKDHLNYYCIHKKFKMNIDDIPTRILDVDPKLREITLLIEVPIFTTVQEAKTYKVINPGFVDKDGTVRKLSVSDRVISLNGTLFEYLGNCQKLTQGSICEDSILKISCLNSNDECENKIIEGDLGFLYIGRYETVIRPSDDQSYITTGSFVNSLYKGTTYKLTLEPGEILHFRGSRFTHQSSLISGAPNFNITGFITPHNQTDKLIEELNKIKKKLETDDQMDELIDPIPYTTFWTFSAISFLMILLTLLIIPLTIYKIFRKNRVKNDRLEAIELGFATLLQKANSPQ